MKHHGYISANENVEEHFVKSSLIPHLQGKTDLIDGERQINDDNFFIKNNKWLSN